MSSLSLILALLLLSSQHTSQQSNLVLEVCGKRTDCPGSSELVTRVVGGQNTCAEQVPWNVIIEDPSKQLQDGGIPLLCGGVLVTEKHVLSAAHCFWDNKYNGICPPQFRNSDAEDCAKANCPESCYRVNLRDIKLHLGVTDRYKPDSGIIREVTKIDFHEGWDKSSIRNNLLDGHDLVVLTMSRIVDFGDRIKPACLPPRNFYPEDGSESQIAGFGRSEFSTFKPLLQSAKLLVHQQESCKKMWKLSGNQICAVGGSINNTVGAEELILTDSCKGDSGGGLTQEREIRSGRDAFIVRETLIGILSGGETDCGKTGGSLYKPGVYTNIGEAENLDFIKNIINEPQQCKVGEECKNCPSLIKKLRKKEVTRTYVASKQCGKSRYGRGTFCCPLIDENSPSYLPRVEDNICGQFYDELPYGDAQPGRYPFAVNIGQKSNEVYTWRCAGTIINRWYVLATAACYSDDQIDLSKEFVNVGDFDLSKKEDCLPGGQVCLPQNKIIQVQEVKINEDYDGSIANDISLVKLSRKIETNKYVRFVCLPLGLPNELRRLGITNYEEDIEGVRAHAVGWGFPFTNFTLISNGDFRYAQDVLQKVELPILSNNECERLFNNRFSLADGTRMCAGGEVGKDLCKGDSGGPLVINKFIRRTGNLLPDHENSVWVQVGMVSFGSSRCGSGKPTVFTRISKYIDWIKQNLN